MYTIQRGDLRFWAGDDWSLILDKAKVFHDHGAAATTLAALQYQQYKGLPVRTFKMELSFLLAADNVEGIGLEQIRKYIAAALRLVVENSVHRDGPVDGSFVQARLHMATLEETVPRRKRF
jgi:hypothetical protein